MGYPILLAVGAALSAAGAGAQIAGASESRSAMNSTMDAFSAREKGLQKKGDTLVQNSLADSTLKASQDQMAQGEKTALDNYSKLEATPLASGSFGAVNPSDPLQSGRISQSNQANANLQGLSEYQLQQHIKDVLTGAQLGVIGGFAQQNAGVLPYQLQDASQAGAGLSGIGSLLGTAGSLAALGGGMGIGGTFGGAETAPTISGTIGNGAWDPALQ